MTIEKEINSRHGFYYYHPKSEPLFNMAFDNRLFEEVQNNDRFPRVILRLYSWTKPAITLGYNQNIEKVIDFNMLDKPVPVLRRITGGRAIYHNETEITFSLTADLRIFPEKDRSLSITNQLISGVVVKILDAVGVTSYWKKKSDGSFLSSAGAPVKSCFNSYSRYEIFSPAGKIVAGAQRRKGNYFIHQGSLKINGIKNCPAIGQINETEAVQESGDSANSYRYTIDQFQKLFPDRFSESLKIKLNKQIADPEFHREICSATDILIKKY